MIAHFRSRFLPRSYTTWTMHSSRIAYNFERAISNVPVQKSANPSRSSLLIGGLTRSPSFTLTTSCSTSGSSCNCASHGMRNEIHISSEVPLDRLSCCCVFCDELVFLSCHQQANTVTKMASEAAMHYIVCLLQSRCASPGESLHQYPQ